MILWREALFLKRLFAPFGEFHGDTPFLKMLGKRFCDDDLQDMMVKSGIISAGCIGGLMGCVAIITIEVFAVTSKVMKS